MEHEWEMKAQHKKQAHSPLNAAEKKALTGIYERNELNELENILIIRYSAL